ncbi:MAG: glycosyltransferase [Desulfobacteraceae bacterium]|nr:glycosyltransferase [Desulfobacteraceae bacterium]
MIIAVVIPTYNEKNNIGRLLDDLFKEWFPKIPWACMHVVVVDDRSPDGTAEIVRSRKKHFSTLHLLSKKKQGLGHAAITGIKYAIHDLEADAVIEMDADFQHNPAVIHNLVLAFTQGADYVIGSRYTAGGDIHCDWSRFRKLISKYGNLFARAFLDISSINDFTSGFKLTRVKGVLDAIDLDTLMELDQFAYRTKPLRGGSHPNIPSHPQHFLTK